MTLSELGKQYICKNFGDTFFCCVKTGLSWYYTVAGTNYNETGGTAQIVSRFASGLIDSLTMTSPARGAFTKAELDAANGSPVTLQDAKEITYHDEPTEVQWCFIPCSAHTDQATCELYGCYWWNSACHDVAPTCEELNNQTECLEHGCVWYNNSCHTALNCEEINNQTECLGHGCFWYNGSCHSTIVCENISTQTECEGHGCYWYNGGCHTSPPACAGLNNQADCERYTCFWWNGACHDAAPSCEALNNELDCSRFGCYWFRGVCHSVDQPELCYWIDDQGGPEVLTVPNVFTIIDAYLYNTPPTGYTFIPTVVNTFGIVDYYLGFNGDPKTGCLYY